MGIVGGIEDLMEDWELWAGGCNFISLQSKFMKLNLDCREI